jgi:glucosamine 6-phosphate synthetase-like amidotransferase/phosphosugar isomerase protein
MCGVWGFDNRGTLDLTVVKEIIERADERGGHSYGIFGLKQNGDQFCYKSHGRSNSDLILNLVKDARVVIGHSRLATSGDLNLFNSQPIVTTDGVLVHNGNIPMSDLIYERYGYRPSTNNDSEALIPMILNKESIDNIEGAFLFLKIDYTSHELIKYNSGLPLFEEQIKDVTYYCSKKWVKY